VALDEAIIEAGAVRFRPMLLTGAAVVVAVLSSSSTRFFRTGAGNDVREIASTTLSRVTIPILYYMVQEWKEQHHIRGKEA
jgi:multidrug efflux pump subunit AcrB